MIYVLDKTVNKKKDAGQRLEEHWPAKTHKASWDNSIILDKQAYVNHTVFYDRL